MHNITVSIEQYNNDSDYEVDIDGAEDLVVVSSMLIDTDHSRSQVYRVICPRFTAEYEAKRAMKVATLLAGPNAAAGTKAAIIADFIGSLLSDEPEEVTEEAIQD